MKRIHLSNFLLLLTVSLVFTIQLRGEDLNPSLFRNPPASASVHTWWHWLDNSITKEGITRDLEAMKKQGILTATILNVGLLDEKDMGVPQVKFGTDEWFRMFEWTLKEANRLGIKIGAHNCDGWSSSGGPWITPEYSMKRTVWSRSVIEGGKKVNLQLPKPAGNHDFYKDIRIIALPLQHGFSSFQSAAPEIMIDGKPSGNLLYDANPFSTKKVKNGSNVIFNFKNEFAAEKIAIHPRMEFSWGDFKNFRYKCELRSSQDGKNFKTVNQFEGTGMNRTSILEIPPTKAKYFQLEFTKISESGSNSLEIGELELLGKDEFPAYYSTIPFHLEKIVTAKADNDADLSVYGEAASGVPLKDIIDITKFMSPEGLLNWDAPKGSWEVMRIGYTTTGAENGPATNAGRGLECDKMDTVALNRHFKGYPAKLIAHAGKYVGNTFDYLFIDSWECNYQNWTANFIREFEKRRHYSMVNWLPVLCGFTVENSEATEHFLQDYRQTIADLIEDNYYTHFNELCHKAGVKSHAEVIYGGTGYPPLDILKSNSHVDVPMFEFWSKFDNKTAFVSYSPVRETEMYIPAQAGALYGKQVIPAEAYTGFANYSETPWDLKLFGDQAFCSGINQMVLHSYVHQPTEKKPGVTLGQYGQSFNRHNPWWDFSSQWFTYQARVQYILQQGVPSADILFFTGDKYYQNTGHKGIYQIPDGYRVQECNLDVLLNHCKIKAGKLLLDNGVSYAMLLLPDDGSMESTTLKRIAELVKEGAVLAGPKPIKVSGYLNYTSNEKSLSDLTATMWGKAGDPENNFGKGKVYSGISIKDILKKQQIAPDFYSNQPGAENLLFFHKKIGSADVYFVVNQEDKQLERECIFRISGKSPQIWDPQYGTVYLPSDSHEVNGTTVVKIKFMPKQSLFFVFDEKKTPGLKVKPELEGKFALQVFKGTLVFEDLPSKIPVSFTNSFTFWTNNSDPDLKYYSGKAKYTINFDLPVELSARKPLYLSLDSMKVACEIKLNGKLLGYSTFPGHLFDISGLLKGKGNLLEVRVANTWRNRIIGDYVQFGDLKNIWTTSPSWNMPRKDKALQESGILGKVMFRY